MLSALKLWLADPHEDELYAPCLCNSGGWMLHVTVQWGGGGRRELIMTFLAVNIQGTKADTFVEKCVLLAMCIPQQHAHAETPPAS